MNVNHLVSDTIARIKNGFTRQKRSILALKSKQTLSIIRILEDEGFIKGYVEKDHQIEIWLKYFDNKSVIENIKVISKPGKRVYFNSKDLMHWKNETNSFEMLILSTTQGILPDHIILEKGIGGEVLCIVR